MEHTCERCGRTVFLAERVGVWTAFNDSDGLQPHLRTCTAQIEAQANFRRTLEEVEAGNREIDRAGDKQGAGERKGKRTTVRR